MKENLQSELTYLAFYWCSTASRFVDSEIALDAALGSVLLLTQDVATFYPEIVRLGVATSLVDLLSRTCMTDLRTVLY